MEYMKYMAEFDYINNYEASFEMYIMADGSIQAVKMNSH